MELTKHWAFTLDDYVIDLAWSHDGLQLAAASSAGPIALRATHDRSALHTLTGHEEGTNTLAWHPRRRLLASGGQDGAAKFWDTDAGQHTATAALGDAWVDHLAWRPSPTADSTSTSWLAAAAGRSITAVLPDGTVRHRFAEAPKTVSALAWHPSGTLLACASFGGVQLWNGDDFSAHRTYAYTNGIHALTWSPDGRWLVSGNQDPSVHLWLPAEDDELHMSGYDGKVRELSFDRTSRWLATGGGQDACVWDCSGKGPEGREPAMLPHDAKVCAVAFQHSHGLLATAAEDGSLLLWSPERAQPLRATVRLPSAATRLAWSPDDQLLAVGSAKGPVYVLKCGS